MQQEGQIFIALRASFEIICCRTMLEVVDVQLISGRVELGSNTTLYEYEFWMRQTTATDAPTPLRSPCCLFCLEAITQ